MESRNTNLRIFVDPTAKSEILNYGCYQALLDMRVEWIGTAMRLEPLCLNVADS